MDRIIQAMEAVNGYLDKVEGRKGFVFDDPAFDELLHVYGVAYFSAAIAAVRGLDSKLAFVIGLFHDTGRISGNHLDLSHGPRGAEIVRKLLGNSGRFSNGELDIICLAVQNHSNKRDIGSQYEEIVKDADVIERVFLMKDKCENSKKKKKRLKNTLEELGLKLSSK